MLANRLSWIFQLPIIEFLFSCHAVSSSVITYPLTHCCWYSNLMIISSPLPSSINIINSNIIINSNGCHLPQRVVTVSATGGDAVRLPVRWILSTWLSHSHVNIHNHHHHEHYNHVHHNNQAFGCPLPSFLSCLTVLPFISVRISYH